MTARFSRAAQQRVEFARKARGHRPRLQLTEYRLNWNSSTSGVLKLGGGTRQQKILPKASLIMGASAATPLNFGGEFACWPRARSPHSPPSSCNVRTASGA